MDIDKEARIRFVDDLKLNYEVKPIIIKVDKEHKWNRQKEKENLRKKIERER